PCRRREGRCRWTSWSACASTAARRRRSTSMRQARAVTATVAFAALAVGAAAQTPQKPLAELPYTPGLDTSAMDPSANACVDFYAYACGGWQKNNPIPPDQPRWGVYGKLYNENLAFLWGLLETAARP